MARSAAAGFGSRQLILLGAAWFGLAATAAADTPPAPPPAHAPQGTAAPTAARGQSGKDMQRQRASAHAANDAPDAAVLEYLGEFDAAGDGLDAMGLAEDDSDTTKPAGNGRR